MLWLFGMGDQNSSAENNEFETNCDFFKLLPLGPEIDIQFLRIILNPYENNIKLTENQKHISRVPGWIYQNYGEKHEHKLYIQRWKW